MRAHRKPSSWEMGFTLIELMIVVVILGILAAIALPNFINMKDRAQESVIRRNAHVVRLAAEDFAVQNNAVYATNLADQTLFGNLTIIGLLPGGNLLINPFLSIADSPVGGAPGAGQVGYGPNPLVPAGQGYRVQGADRHGNVIVNMTSGS